MRNAPWLRRLRTRSRRSEPRRALEPLLEALDLAGGVDDGLLARVERMAVGAHVHAQGRARGPHREGGVARGARHRGLVVRGMDVGLHDGSLRECQAPWLAAGACSMM